MGSPSCSPTSAFLPHLLPGQQNSCQTLQIQGHREPSERSGQPLTCVSLPALVPWATRACALSSDLACSTVATAFVITAPFCVLFLFIYALPADFLAGIHIIAPSLTRNQNALPNTLSWAWHTLLLPGCCGETLTLLGTMLVPAMVEQPGWQVSLDELGSWSLLLWQGGGSWWQQRWLVIPGTRRGMR